MSNKYDPYNYLEIYATELYIDLIKSIQVHIRREHILSLNVDNIF